jgi:hypothetical protein
MSTSSGLAVAVLISTLTLVCSACVQRSWPNDRCYVVPALDDGTTAELAGVLSRFAVKWGMTSRESNPAVTALLAPYPGRDSESYPDDRRVAIYVVDNYGPKGVSVTVGIYDETVRETELLADFDRYMREVVVPRFGGQTCEAERRSRPSEDVRTRSSG